MLGEGGGLLRGEEENGIGGLMIDRLRRAHPHPDRSSPPSIPWIEAWDSHPIQYTYWIGQLILKKLKAREKNDERFTHGVK